ncbi:peptidylprolyl isomerase [Hallella seregens]|uniref:Peptidylprolyl isomerase n=1 Tax=Hallella seregens ATCC 51272 TaxID=1336250 RepID=A0ABV5ZMJ8_9BACT|nr:peptidylprolyl isomerase [Hallella seregens]
MNTKLLLGAMLMCGSFSFAQSDDPVLMTVNGHAVTRSEFEYSYNKNNSEGVIDKKTVKEYVPLFVNYKLKVEAAKAARLDTMRSFQQEFAGYRDQQIRPAMINDADVEAEARKIYAQTQQQVDGNGGMVQVSHILLLLPQKASADEQKVAKQRVDSVYEALRRGADFAEMASKVSQDPGSAAKGGELPLIVKGQTLREFEDQAWQLKDGEMSKPFLSPAGWHIILKRGHQNFYSYESQREAILKFIDQRNLREQIINAKLDTLSRQEHTTPAQLLEAKKQELEAQDPSLKYLIQEYHDGLLLYEISNRTVWDKAQKDEAGQAAYFKHNKKKYKWEQPRFKGIAYSTRDEADVKRVQTAVKKLPFDAWAEQLRKTFNADSVLRIRVEKGIFKQGDNALVDQKVFGVDTVPQPMKGYPYMAVYGKKLKAPEELADVKALVVADYQEELERQWVEQLRRQYPVTVDEQVLDTVNKHK